jgi:hypothetical protein
MHEDSELRVGKRVCQMLWRDPKTAPSDRDESEFPVFPTITRFSRVWPNRAFLELNPFYECAYALTRRPGNMNNVGNAANSPSPLRDSREVRSQVAMFAASGGRRMRHALIPWPQPCFLSGQGVCRKRDHRRKKGIPLPVGVRGPGGPRAKAPSGATNELADRRQTRKALCSDR